MSALPIDDVSVAGGEVAGADTNAIRKIQPGKKSRVAKQYKIVRRDARVSKGDRVVCMRGE